MNNTDRPDIYANGVMLGTTPFDVTLTFTVPVLDELPSTPGHQMQSRPVVCGTVRMSHEQAKVLSILLRKALKQHEDAVRSPIPILDAVCKGMGISLSEDW